MQLDFFQRGIHRPVSIVEHPRRRAQLRQADLHALLRVEAWPQDRHVLPPDKGSGGRHPVHRGQDQGRGHSHRQERGRL